MAESVLQAVRLPPRDALAYFRQKENVPTQHWNDLWHEAHAKGFMVAGAAHEGLLRDLRQGVDKAIADGMTMAQWRAEFPQIADRYGWKYNGSPGWRADIIYDTNMSTALAAGRYRRMVTPEALELYPYWRYTHHSCQHPRVQHEAWDGLVLRADDPWWQTHFPPNGWRCHCTVEVVSEAKRKRMGWDVSEAPPIETRPWNNPRNGTVHQVPVGIDPGFAYNPGAAWIRNEDARAGRTSTRFPTAQDMGPASTPGPIAQPQSGPQPHPPALPIASEPDAARPVDLTPEQTREIQKRAVREQHEAALRDGRVPPQSVEVGTVSPDVSRVMGAHTRKVLLSRDTLTKQLGWRKDGDAGQLSKGHPELTIEEYTKLPDILAHASIVAIESKTHVMLLRRDAHWYRATVKFTQDGSEAYLMSFHRMTSGKAKRALKKCQIIKGSLEELEEDDVPGGPAGNPP